MKKEEEKKRVRGKKTENRREKVSVNNTRWVL